MEGDNKSNFTERLLIQISQDVASIKSDLMNYKEIQKMDKEQFHKELADLRSDLNHDIAVTKDELNARINGMQSVQNTLVGEVDTLKHADANKDAKKWKTTMAFVATGLGGMLISKLPDIINLLVTKGN